jgi:hypothetical protein
MPRTGKTRQRREGRRNDGSKDFEALGLLALGCLGLAMLSKRSPGAAVPPQPRYVAIPTEIFDFVAASQEQDMWCWAASIQMILNLHGVPINQEQIVSRVYGISVNEPGTDEAISRGLNGWGIDADGRRFIVQSWTAVGPPSPGILLRELSHGRPILLTFDQGLSVGHAVVVSGASFVGPWITSLVYRDPWPTAANCANRGRVEVSGAGLGELLSRVRSHWLVSVSMG